MKGVETTSSARDNVGDAARRVRNDGSDRALLTGVVAAAAAFMAHFDGSQRPIP